MQKITLLILVAVILFPLLLISEVTYLNEEDYKKLKKSEREVYNQSLLDEMEALKGKKSDANYRSEKANERIAELQGKIAAVEEQHAATYNEILDYLNIDPNDTAQWKEVESKIGYFNKEITNFNSLSDTELWEAKKRIYSLREEWNEYKKQNNAKLPDFVDDVITIENRLTRLESDLESKRPVYYEDEYTVVKGETLSKISGYHFIYNDPTKWGIIYRANRDQIKDPNIINPNQVLKIPRGKPNSWKVYTGEFLWKIASYPEVYGNGAKWTLIYRANKDKIKDPDLIYPNQVFEIPRD